MSRAEARVTYETLRTVQEPQCGRFPLCTVNDYQGGVDGEGRFHGKGVVDSCMGFRYSGEFCHGQIEGTGVMAWADGYTVQGTFKDGIANGKGTLTWPNGDVFVGDIVNGVRHGRGTMTTHGGKATYKGGWSHGQRAGWGCQYYADGAVYEGEWSHDERNGRGALTYASGDCYDGEWVAGQRHGLGAMGWKRSGRRYVELYDGSWAAGAPQGYGQSTYIRYPDDSAEGADAAAAGCVVSPAVFTPPADAVVNLYSGNYENGQRSGWGCFFYADGSSYKGCWASGKKNGQGTYTSAIGTPYTGMFVDDSPVGMPAFSPIGAGQTVVPSVHIQDLRSVCDESEEAMMSKTTSLLLRFNTVLKNLFHAYARKDDDIAFAYTPADWWRHRVPGHLSTPQFLRLLSDAGILDGLVTMSVALRRLIDTAKAEMKNEPASEVGAAPNPPNFVAGANTGPAALKLIFRAEAWLDYRQFAESLIRLSADVCVGAHYGDINDKFNSLVEDRLKGTLRDLPLCQLTRQHEAAIRPLLPQLDGLYAQLLDIEHAGRVTSESFLPMRALLRLLQPLLTQHGLTPQDAVRIMFPFQRNSSRQLPPGLNVVNGEKELALAQELYMTGCGKETSGTASLLVSGVIASQELTLIDFVECVVALGAAICGDENKETALHDTIKTGILTLPL